MDAIRIQPVVCEGKVKVKLFLCFF